jgi:hypothetical protein
VIFPDNKRKSVQCKVLFELEYMAYVQRILVHCEIDLVNADVWG